MLTRIEAQPGPQTKFLSSPADIVIYGGAAGGGKTYGLLLEPARHSNNPNFGAVVFRRTAVQITTEGGLWDTALNLFLPMGIEMRTTPPHQIRFKSGATISFTHLQHEKNVYDWQGAQIPLIEFDELTHFTKAQFFYMLSRNRSICGVKPYVRATCNPDPDSWVADFISWWWDSETGYAISERSGTIRWFGRRDDAILWADSPGELYTLHGIPAADAKSVTFIASSVYDNKILLENDPAYISNLKALDRVNRERLLLGNWKVRASAGMYFKRADAEIIDAIPAGQVLRWVRRWDLAATEPSEANRSPDRTAGALMGKLKDGRYIIADVQAMALNATKVRTILKNTAVTDRSNYGMMVKTVLPQDPGQAGKDQAQSLVKWLSGFNVQTTRETGSKIVRAEPLAAQWQSGNVLVLAGRWNEEFFNEMESFPEGLHDDIPDSAAGAFNELNAVSYDLSAML